MWNTIFERYRENVDWLTPIPSSDWKNKSIQRRIQYWINLIITHEFYLLLMKKFEVKDKNKFNK